MTATAHAVLGTVIAAKIGNPLLAIPIAFASHFVADLVPHWDVGIGWRKKTKERFFVESAIDLLTGYLLSYGLIFFLFPETNLFYAFLIITIAQLPDWLMVPYLYLKARIPFFKFFYTLQHNLNRSLNSPWGVINQVVILLAIITFAKYL